MRKFVDAGLLIIIIAVGAFLYLNFEEVTFKVRSLINGAPCSKPIVYSLGEIDSRFNLSKEEVLSFVDKSAIAWEEVSGKDLFKYVEGGGGVVINFKYDKRQEVTETLATLDGKIDLENANIKVLKSNYDSLLALYRANKVNYDIHKNNIAEAERKYQQELSAWNRSKRTSKSEFDNLNAAREHLANEYILLNQEASALNNQIKEINKLAQELNNTVAIHNTNVREYNVAAASFRGEFEEGEYVLEGGKEEINIYQFEDTNKLIRVLEHEFGHALGLDHVEDSSAIMYAVNKGGSEKPGATDLAELQRICKK